MTTADLIRAEAEAIKWEKIAETLQDQRDAAERQLAETISRKDKLIDDLVKTNQIIATHREVLEKALRSIASNTCCDRCQEAALVACSALRSTGLDADGETL